MASAAPPRPRRAQPLAKRERLLDKLLAAGAGAIAAGVFALTVAWWQSNDEGEKTDCEIAAQLITDDQLNPALSEPQRSAIAAIALERTRRCLDE